MTDSAAPNTEETRYLKGVGPRRAELLLRLGIATVGDLLLHRPRVYLDRRSIQPIGTLRADMEVTISASVTQVTSSGGHGRRARVVAHLADPSGRIEAVWFGQPYLLRLIRSGQRVLVSGKTRWWRGLMLTNPEFEILEKGALETGLTGGRIVPVYPLTAGLSQRTVRSAVRAALDRLGPDPLDPLPAEIRRRLRLPSVAEAYNGLHFPVDLPAAESARRRFAFEELLFFQIYLLRLRQERAGMALSGHHLNIDRDEVDAFRRSLPFRLTGAQERAIDAILNDLAGGRPMSRLLQGDVGSGKTVVAASACLSAVRAGSQACFLAPTEILAIQHDETLTRLLEPLGVRIARLIGRTPKRERKEILTDLAEGRVDLLIGTHALLEPDVRFRDLSLVVVDEQQRFGVYQRLQIRKKGVAPHLLVMSATPIPRTLALTLYGDLDITILDEIPPGRTPVRTRIVDRSRWEDLLRFIAGRLREGDQAFFVYPLIEESKALDLRDATRMWEEIKRHEAFSGLQIGLLHGRVDSEARESTLTEMREGRIAALVATTVIEVGIDLPRATLMVIEHPDRFGLSQLHQLRGRIGRAPGSPPYLFLMRPESPSAGLERLEVLVRESDGFRVAEEDLRLRGPGELLGKRQTGIPMMRFADLVLDRSLLEEARREAVRILNIDPGLSVPSHRVLMDEVRRRFPEGQSLFGTG